MICVFDIETGPLSAESLLVRFPFDPTAIKCGNLKDEAKIAEKIEEARASHLVSLQDKAALDPISGQILAIGYIRAEGTEQRFDWKGVDGKETNEAVVLHDFWQKYAWCKASKVPLVGFNSHYFDLPFIIARSWFWQVPMPPYGELIRGRYFEPPSVDLKERWNCGRFDPRGSLNDLAQFFRIGKKDGSGANFHKLYASNRDEAVAYLKNDLELTAGIAGWMGLQ